MDDYTKYLLLSHLHWIDNGITRDEVLQAYQKIKDEDIFSGVKLHQIQKKMGYEVDYKEVITATEYEKIKFLWLNLSRVKIDLSFVKFCSNLVEINIGCFDEINLDIVKNNFKLKRIIANSNNIKTLEALYDHHELEFINIEDNPCISLKPIAHLKKIKELKVGLIVEEMDVLNILKNNAICKVIYILKGGETDFENFIFPYYNFVISKTEDNINIHIEGVNDESSYASETKIPQNLLENIEYSERLMISLSEAITKRLEIILGKKISFDFNNSFSFGFSYHLNYVHQI
jgi:hypothetical protein